MGQSGVGPGNALVALALLLANGAPCSRSPAARLAHPSGKSLFALTKPRIIELLLITTLPTMIVAERGLPPLWLMVATLLGGAFAAGGANAINMVVDRDIDKLMERTKNRPLVTGAISARSAPHLCDHPRGGSVRRAVGLGQPAVCSSCGVGDPLLRVRVHPVVEANQQPEHRDRWSSRSGPGAGRVGGSDQQFVVDAGGAVRDHLRVDAATLLGAGGQVQGRLSGSRRPMLPAVATFKRTAREIVLYSVALVGVSLLLAAVAHLGVIYVVSAVVLGGFFVALSIRLWRRTTPKAAMQLFSYSITYLTLLFVLMAVDIFTKH